MPRQNLYTDRDTFERDANLELDRLARMDRSNPRFEETLALWRLLRAQRDLIEAKIERQHITRRA